jgi:hypothetical protein
MIKKLRIIIPMIVLGAILVFSVSAQEDPGFEGGGGSCVSLATNDATCRGGSIVPKCGFVISGNQAKNCNFSAST